MLFLTEDAQCSPKFRLHPLSVVRSLQGYCACFCGVADAMSSVKRCSLQCLLCVLPVWGGGVVLLSSREDLRLLKDIEAIHQRCFERYIRNKYLHEVCFSNILSSSPPLFFY